MRPGLVVVVSSSSSIRVGREVQLMAQKGTGPELEADRRERMPMGETTAHGPGESQVTGRRSIQKGTRAAGRV